VAQDPQHKHQHSQILRNVVDELARLSVERKRRQQMLYDSEGDDDALASPLQELPDEPAPSTYITYRGKSVVDQRIRRS
jgi:hypothetical protein